MTPEEFDRKFRALLLGTDEGRPITDEELELLLEVERLAENPLGQARMRAVVQKLPVVLFRRTLGLEEVAAGLGVPTAWILHLAESGLLTGTLTPDGRWLFSPSDIYAHVYPGEGEPR